MINYALRALYLILIIIINFYAASFIVNKISSRADRKRGFSSIKIRGFGYPFARFFKYIGKDYRISIWEVLLLFFSFFIWALVPFNQSIVLIRFESDLLIALLFYIILIFLMLISSSKSLYSFIFSNNAKRYLMIIAFSIPVILSIASIVFINRTLAIREIVSFQYRYPNIIFQPLGFIVVFISSFMQIKILGLTRKNTLLYSGNMQKEGSGLGRIANRAASYSAAFFLIILMIILYFAGWQNLYFINGNIMMGIKFYLLFFILVLLDKTTPGLNDYKYLASINLRFLLPVSGLNLLITVLFFMLRNIYSLI